MWSPYVSLGQMKEVILLTVFCVRMYISKCDISGPAHNYFLHFLHAANAIGPALLNGSLEAWNKLRSLVRF